MPPASPTRARPTLKSMSGLKALNLYHTLVTEKAMQRPEGRAALLCHRIRPRLGAAEPEEQVRYEASRRLFLGCVSCLRRLPQLPRYHSGSKMPAAW